MAARLNQTVRVKQGRESKRGAADQERQPGQETKCPGYPKWLS